MAEQDAFAIPDRIAIDAKGYGWRVWDDEDYWSMVPTTTDNDPIAQPVTWFVKEPKLVQVGWRSRTTGEICDCPLGETSPHANSVPVYVMDD